MITFGDKPAYRRQVSKAPGARDGKPANIFYQSERDRTIMTLNELFEFLGIAIGLIALFGLALAWDFQDWQKGR